MQLGGVLGIESESLGGGAQTDCQCLATGKVETAQQLLGIPTAHAVDTAPDTFHCCTIQQRLEVTPACHGKDLCRRRNAVLVFEEVREFCVHEVMVSNPTVPGKSALWMTTVRELRAPRGVLADRHARSRWGS
jgi:hypothetical protein